MWNTLRHVACGKAVVITTRMFSFHLLERFFYQLTPFHHRFNGGSICPCQQGWDHRKTYARYVLVLHLYLPWIITRLITAVGTTDSLSARYATYEVHFTCRTREELNRAQELMSHIPGSKLAEDVATRFEVPIQQENGGLSLAEVFHILSSRGDFSEYTVEKVTLEGVFLKVIRENNILEEDRKPAKVRRWWPWRRVDT